MSVSSRRIGTRFASSHIHLDGNMPCLQWDPWSGQDGEDLSLSWTGFFESIDPRSGFLQPYLQGMAYVEMCAILLFDSTLCATPFRHLRQFQVRIDAAFRSRDALAEGTRETTSSHLFCIDSKRQASFTIDLHVKDVDHWLPSP